MFSAVSSFSSALFSGLCTVFTSEAPDTPPVDTGKPPRRLHARHRPGNVNRKHRVRLCTLSLEMFLEIFENVDLVDLWALSMTSRAFRKTLLSPIMNPVWKRVFIANKAPSPPDEIPRLQWIHWLYLVKTCSTPGCARKGTHAVFWTLQKLCTTCRGEQYISQPSLPYHPMFRNIHLWVVIATVPHHIGYKPHEVQPVRYYPIAELQALSVEWNEAQHFDERTMLRWLNNKIAPVQELMTLTFRGHEWVASMRSKQQEEREARKRLSKTNICRHLQELGFERIDIDAVNICRKGRMSGRGLKKDWIETTIAPLVEQAKQKRLAALPPPPSPAPASAPPY